MIALDFKNTVLLAKRMLNRQSSLFSLTGRQILTLWHGSFKAHPDAQGTLQAAMHGALIYLHCKPVCSSMMIRTTAQGNVAYRENPKRGGGLGLYEGHTRCMTRVHDPFATKCPLSLLYNQVLFVAKLNQTLLICFLCLYLTKNKRRHELTWQIFSNWRFRMTACWVNTTVDKLLLHRWDLWEWSAQNSSYYRESKNSSRDPDSWK